MHGLGLIRPITRTERLNLERLHKGCEARGCHKQPECAITRESSGEVITVFACIEHARSWVSDEDAKPDAADGSDPQE